MKVVVTKLSPVHPNHNELTITDNQGREAVIRKGDVKTLKKLLTQAQYQSVVGWGFETAGDDFSAMTFHTDGSGLHGANYLR